MVIAGLVVCVDYAHLLSLSLGRWKGGLESLLVVTAPRDTDTISLCKRYGVETYETKVFWERGALFNKGAALADAFDFLGPFDWVLFFDADIVPEEGWRGKIEEAGPTPGTLYGASRYDASGNLIPDECVAGFFLLASVWDPNLRQRPVVSRDFYHCGNYDSDLLERWPKERRVRLPIHLTHHGEVGKNWCGVGNEKEMARLHQERQRIGGWRHETLPPAPLSYIE